jgi:hypothetical protein
MSCLMSRQPTKRLAKLRQVSQMQKLDASQLVKFYLKRVKETFLLLVHYHTLIMYLIWVTSSGVCYRLMSTQDTLD